MSRGNPNRGLLKAIIQVMNDLGQKESWDSNHVTRVLERKGQWAGRQVKSPSRTVNMYFNQNPEVFDKADTNSFSLKKAYWHRA